MAGNYLLLFLTQLIALAGKLLQFPANRFYEFYQIIPAILGWGNAWVKRKQFAVHVTDVPRGCLRDKQNHLLKGKDCKLIRNYE